MRERPIIFGGDSVRAILAGTKTQTRRAVKPQPRSFAGGVHPNHVARHPAPYIDAYCGERPTEENPRGMGDLWCWWTEDDRMGPEIGRCPYGAPGDRLWVRETWAKAGEVGDEVEYRADNPDPLGARWRPSIYMPRAASRIALEVVDVRVQRLQEISEEDARAEGARHFIDDLDGRAYDNAAKAWARWTKRIDPGACVASQRGAFAAAWERINGKRDGCSWAANPCVWCITFQRIESAARAA